MTQASLAIEQWQVSRGISFLPSGGNFMPMVYCLVACSWLGKFSTGCTLSTGFLWLLVTDFFVHWQSGFLCSTLRHRFARSVPMVLGTDQHQHRHSAKEVRLPNSLPRPTVHHVCVWAFLGNRCMFSVLNCTRNPEWVLRRHCGDGPAGYRGGVSALSGASCYSQHCHWPLPQFNRSSEAIQTSFLNLE